MAKAKSKPYKLPKKVMIPLVIVVVLVLVACLALNALAVHSAGMKVTLTLTDDGKLPACDATGNCVVSEEGYATDGIEPLPLIQDIDMTNAVLFRIVKGMEGVTYESGANMVMHATAKSRLWGFVDDMFFRIDPQAGVVHIRFASRVGKSDFGANRKRYEEIRRAWRSMTP